MDQFYHCDLNILAPYYVGLMVLLLSYGIIISYLSLFNTIGEGLHIIWLSFTLILAAKEDNPIEFLGLSINKRAVILFLVGSTTALVIFSAVILIIVSINNVSVIHNSSLNVSIGILEGLISTFFIAFSEEIIFRGYPIRKMRRCANNSSNLFLTGLIFSLFHLFNPGFNLNALIFLILAHVLLGKFIVDSNNLWVSIAFHFTWNFIQGYILGLPISGFIPKATMFKIKLRGSELLTGGDFGIEGSLVSVLIFSLALIIYERIRN